ncbi:MAG: diadenylate cyclase CdaA [Cytophagales bacterium]|nr:diadenylate cyclase CdaA [Cytophagales bacterium]
MIYLLKIGFLEVRFVDILDVTFVSILLYQVYKLMRGSMAVKVFIGFLSLYLLYLVVNATGMELLSAILGQFMGVGVIALIVLFQQEIRKFLLIIGRTTVFDKDNIIKSLMRRNLHADDHINLSPIVEATKAMSNNMTGALIVFSKDNPLNYYAESGDRIDGLASKRLLLAVFDKNSPLHDGAVIIHGERVVAARCILPVSEKPDIPAQFGLRHRAAIGMTEVTNTMILVVSEETGQMSIVRNGIIDHNLSAQEIRAKLNAYLLGKEFDPNKKNEPAENEPRIAPENKLATNLKTNTEDATMASLEQPEE